MNEKITNCSCQYRSIKSVYKDLDLSSYIGNTCPCLLTGDKASHVNQILKEEGSWFVSLTRRENSR